MSDAVNGVAPAVRAMFAADVASHSLGIELVEASAGQARARMRIDERMVNGHGIAHGGYVFLLADTAFACACNTDGPTTVASGADISFVASSRLGDVLVATAQERTRYGRSGIYDVTVRRDNSPEVGDGGELDTIAEFRGRSRTIDRSERQRAG